MFEAEHSERTSLPASAVWARWAKPARWSEWDSRVQHAEADGELAEGVAVRVKLRKGGATHHRVTAFEPGGLLTTEYALPGGRVGHEHRVEARGPGSEVTHRLYVDGPFWPLWALMLSRKRLRDAVAGFTDARP
ncbi:MAG TPA: SRPBCC family protein [Solirubrobacterales bacterium]